jgi:hypothetical protein
MAKDPRIQDNRLKTNALMRFSQFRLARWTNRRQIEWKMSASFWALLVALNASIALKKVTMPWKVLAVGLAIFTAMHFWWVHQNWRRNQGDIKSAFDSFSMSYEILGLPPIERKEGPQWMLMDAIPALEFLITVGLCLTAVYFASFG